jgi:hypothetical protein
MMELSQDVYFKNIIFIRFNPDSYKIGDKKVTSCWTINKNNTYCIKNNKLNDWNERLNTLINKIKYSIENIPEKLINIIELYYDLN